jgi:hypothetical protein
VKATHASILRATVIDADALKNLISLLTAWFAFDDGALNENCYRNEVNERVGHLVFSNESGAINGFLRGCAHVAFFANGTITWLEEMYVTEATRRSGSLRAGAEASWRRATDRRVEVQCRRNSPTSRTAHEPSGRLRSDVASLFENEPDGWWAFVREGLERDDNELLVRTALDDDSIGPWCASLLFSVPAHYGALSFESVTNTTTRTSSPRRSLLPKVVKRIAASCSRDRRHSMVGAT